MINNLFNLNNNRIILLLFLMGYLNVTTLFGQQPNGQSESVKFENQDNIDTAFHQSKEEYPKLAHRIVKTGNAFKVDILNPLFNPKYKNISTSDGLEIDDSSWEENHSLILETTKNAEFKVLIQDSIGQKIIIPLGSTFEVTMEEQDSIYYVSILGEEKPFHVELFNANTQHKQDFITHEDHIIFPKATLLKNGFSGEYLVRVSYGNNQHKLELAQTIFLEKQKHYRSRIVKILIFLLLIISAFLLFISKRKKQEETIIFHD